MTHDPLDPVALQRADQAATARACGYGDGPDAVDRLSADHDRLHVALCGLLGRPSPTLRWVASGYKELAHPTRHDDAVGWEEALTLAAARWLNTGEYADALRVLWWHGLEPTAVRRYLLGALGRFDEAAAEASWPTP